MPDIYDPDFVKDVFDKCSDSYIKFSYYCSFGFTERWRKQCVDLFTDLPKAAVGLDLMAGTGEVWPHLLKKFPNTERITAIDISSGMHKRAMERLHKLRADKIEFIKDNILASKLSPNSADFVVSTFGLKTFNREQHQKLAKVINHVLKPGGQFALIEASDPKGWIFRWPYMFHLRCILPIVERALLRGATDFKMIGIYSKNFGNASRFAKDLESYGLEVRYKKHFFGCATSVSGRKPY